MLVLALLWRRRLLCEPPTHRLDDLGPHELDQAFSLIFFLAGLGRSEKPLTVGAGVGRLEKASMTGGALEDSTVGELDDEESMTFGIFRKWDLYFELRSPRLRRDERFSRGDQTAAVVSGRAEKSRFPACLRNRPWIKLK